MSAGQAGGQGRGRGSLEGIVPHLLLRDLLLRLLLPLFRTSQPGTTGQLQVLRWIYPRSQPWRAGVERGNHPRHRLVTGQYGLVLGADNSRVRRVIAQVGHLVRCINAPRVLRKSIRAARDLPRILVPGVLVRHTCPPRPPGRTVLLVASRWALRRRLSTLAYFCLKKRANHHQAALAFRPRLSEVLVFF